MGNTKKVGNATEAVVMAEFLKAGFPVLMPFGENNRYDLVVETGGRFLSTLSASRSGALRRYHEPRCLTYGKLCITYRASAAGLRHSASR